MHPITLSKAEIWSPSPCLIFTATGERKPGSGRVCVVCLTRFSVRVWGNECSVGQVERRMRTHSLGLWTGVFELPLHAYLKSDPDGFILGTLHENVKTDKINDRTTLAHWLEGYEFKSQVHNMSTSGPLCKALNPSLHSCIKCDDKKKCKSLLDKGVCQMLLM